MSEKTSRVGLGRVGLAGFQNSWVGSGHPDRIGPVRIPSCGGGGGGGGGSESVCVDGGGSCRFSFLLGLRRW